MLISLVQNIFAALFYRTLSCALVLLQMWSTKRVYLLAATCLGKLGILDRKPGYRRNDFHTGTARVRSQQMKTFRRHPIIWKCRMKLSSWAAILTVCCTIMVTWSPAVEVVHVSFIQCTHITYAYAYEWDQRRLKIIYPVFLHECLASIKLSMADEHQANMCITPEISCRLRLN